VVPYQKSGGPEDGIIQWGYRGGNQTRTDGFNEEVELMLQNKFSTALTILTEERQRAKTREVKPLKKTTRVLGNRD
jgi:hypothetical protein